MAGIVADRLKLMADEFEGERRSRGKTDVPPVDQSAGQRKGPQRWSFSNWRIFLNERAPPLVFVLLALGPTLSVLSVVEGRVDLEKFLWASFGLWLLLLIVRVMDDVKDYDKDVIVHPDRPLPRGLIAYDEVALVVKITLAILIGYSVLMAVRYGPQVGGFFAFVVFYSFLMYIEFGIGEWLEERPLIYAMTHQVCIYFCAVFVCVLAGGKWYSIQGVKLGSLALSGFFTYEVCRKLDPTFPLIKGTYLIVYGKLKTYLITMVTVAIGFISSYLTGLHYMLWPMQALMLTSLLVLFLLPQPRDKEKKTKTHKPVEGIAVLYILTHMWAGFIHSIYKWYF